MKKKLLKIMALVGLAAMMTVGLAGCKKTQCYLCEEMKHCKTYDDYILGEMNLCKDCKEAIAPMSENLKEYLEGVE